MTERWVKATMGKGVSAWVNMAHAGSIHIEKNLTQIGFVGDGESCTAAFKEPPEHFLPVGAASQSAAWAFLNYLASIPPENADGPGLVREAKKIMEAARRR